MACKSAVYNIIGVKNCIKLPISQYLYSVARWYCQWWRLRMLNVTPWCSTDVWTSSPTTRAPALTTLTSASIVRFIACVDIVDAKYSVGTRAYLSLAITWVLNIGFSTQEYIWSTTYLVFWIRMQEVYW